MTQQNKIMSEKSGFAVKLNDIGFSYKEGGETQSFLRLKFAFPQWLGKKVNSQQSFSNKEGREIYNSFSLSIASKSKISLMGANGVGKSTLGKIIAGLLSPAKGNVSWSNAFGHKSDIFYFEQRPMNNVFPWLNVLENLKYPLKKLGWSKTEIKYRSAELCEIFKLNNLLRKYPARLSGGELQRLALARCFSWSPKLMILDEPFSALDTNARSEILKSVRELADKSEMTLILITHNLHDTLFLADRCVIIGDNPVSIVSDVELKNGQSQNGTDNELIEKLLAEGLRYGIL